MSIRNVTRLAALALVSWVAPATASAQVFGTFPWQMQPYCNIVTLTLTNTPAGFTLDGTDDQCGTSNKASAVGMATFNGAGNVTLNVTIVTAPSGKPVHVSAVVSPANGNGTWTDSVGNTGTFAFVGATPGLPLRPLPASGIGPATITALEIAPAAVGASELAAAAVRASHLGVITERSALSGTIPAGGAGVVQVNCNAGEQVISGGFFASSDVFATASFRSGNGWQVIAYNSSASNRAIFARAYCLAQ